MFRTILSRSVVCCIAASGVSHLNNAYYASLESKKELTRENINFPTRDTLINQLKSKEPFDIIIIGGGATGAGVAYEAISRGLKVALVDRADYSSGTSSKSTKLIHGGIRYLQKAVFSLDYNEYLLVKESLHERSLLMETCPHLVKKVPIMLPIYSYFDGVKMFFGLKLYDWISGQSEMHSYYISKQKVSELFPYLKLNPLKFGYVYFDAQQDDSRMNLTVIKTAISKGAVACNYVEAEKLIKRGNTIQGVVMKDKLTNTSFECYGKVIVNATGPFTDKMRKLADPNANPICYPSSGVHLSLPQKLSENDIGILIYEEGNRVLFVLPWQGSTLVGTTDVKSAVIEKPTPSGEDIDYILKHFNEIIENDKAVSLKDVKSAWSGLRPLVVEPKHAMNSNISSSMMTRTHLIESHDNVVSVSGGKWTTFRQMGEDAVNKILSILGSDSEANKSKAANEKFQLFDGVGWSESYHTELESKYNLPSPLARYLSNTYGTYSDEIAKIIKQNNPNNKGTVLHADFPYTEEEIVYICRSEYVCKMEDIVGRRLRLAFLNNEVAYNLIPRIADIAAKELKWSDAKKLSEIEETKAFVDKEMGRLITAKAQK